MIPITRKELYLNRIVGNNDYDIPEKPITEEELFFAEILGEAVQAPEPLPRYQLYLAKIAGRDIEIPTPITRLEYFLAKAAGMDITVPVPITREEIYWSNYTAIVDFEVEGVPPLTYKAVEGTLENYRIYGNTVGGESVGDLVESGEHAGEYKASVTVEGKNLLQNTATSQTINGVTFTVNDDGSLTCNGTAEQTIFLSINNYIRIDGNVILSGCPDGGGSDSYMLRINSSGTITTRDQGSGANAINPRGMVEIRIVSGYTCNNVTFYPMIRKADIENDTYEPYRVPTTTPIYLPEQIKKVGDEAEYVDYKEQKQHFADGTSADVTLPAMPTLSGTNTLSVGTEVQPSKVYIKGEKEREYT